MTKLDKLFATGETVTGKQYMQAMLADIQESRASSKYDERMTMLKDKFKVSKLETEITPENQAIDLTTPSSKPITVERVRELRDKIDTLSYVGRSSTGWRWEVDATPKRESSPLNKAYGRLEYSVSR